MKIRERDENSDNKEKLSLMQLIILALSIYVLTALGLQTLLKLPPEVDDLLNAVDTMICFVFLFDFFFRLSQAPSRLGFLKWGWIDLVSSIPTITFLRWGRIFRAAKIVRILRGFKSTKELILHVYGNRAKGTFATVVLISVLLVIFSSIAIINFETDNDSGFKTPADALWWSVVTITTVGNCNKYPATLEGRCVAILLTLAGVGLFGTFTGYMANFFLEPDQKNEIAGIEKLAAEIRCLNGKIESMERKIDEITKKNFH